MTGPPSDRARAAPGAWLLAQVGAHAASAFAERLAPLGFTPPLVGILRILGAEEGPTQQALSEHLGLHPSRLVAFLDDLEQRGLVERRNNPADRRSYSLFLTQAGARALTALGRVGREHQRELLRALSEEEREALASMLQRIADDQGLKRGVHPGLGRLGPP